MKLGPRKKFPKKMCSQLHEAIKHTTLLSTEGIFLADQVTMHDYRKIAI